MGASEDEARQRDRYAKLRRMGKVRAELERAREDEMDLGIRVKGARDRRDGGEGGSR